MRTGTRGTGWTTLTRTLRTRSGTPLRASSPLSHFEFPPSVISNRRRPFPFSIFTFLFSNAARGTSSVISNRQWLARLENAVTRGKQTPEAKSNRHIREGRQIRDAYSVQTFTSISPCSRLAPFSIFTFPTSDISNRQWLRRLETMSNPLKINADHDF